MKANELRVGNWITEYGIPRKIRPMDIVGLHQIEQSQKVCIDLTPIPLTEEWLLKLGAKRFHPKDSSYSGIGFYINEGHNLEWSAEEKIMYIVQTDDPYYNLELKTNYIHQLQNLNFALTGKELEIKTDAQDRT